MNKFILPLFFLFIVVACQPKSEKTSSEKADTTVNTEIKPKELSPINKIEASHQKDVFLSKEAIQYNIRIEFGGNEILNAHITTLTNSSSSLIELDNGEKIYVVKDKVYCSEGLAESKSVRFSAYTWNYFLLLPYKLNDAGTIWSDYSQQTVSDVLYDTQKLTFESGTGDAPDDWYIVYSDSQSKLIKYAAYIVTAGKTKEKAEEDPHAIEYAEFKNIDGIPIAHNWVFWEWRMEEGFTKTIGKAELSNITFVDNVKEMLIAPSDYIEK